MRSTIKLFVPVACIVMGLLVVVSGCGKEQPVETPSPSAEPVKIPSNSPAAYMKDKDFMAKIDAWDREQRAIVGERLPLLKRLKELSPDGKSVREENMAEFKKLRARVDALNARYEKIRREQLAAVREKMTPRDLKAKRAVKPQNAKEISK